MTSSARSRRRGLSRVAAAACVPATPTGRARTAVGARSRMLLGSPEGR